MKNCMIAFGFRMELDKYIPKEILEQMIEVCNEVINGMDDKEDFHFFMGGDYKVAHKMLENQMREDGRDSLISFIIHKK